MNARTLPACPDKIADKPALLAGLLMQRDAEIRELREALEEMVDAWDGAAGYPIYKARAILAKRR